MLRHFPFFRFLSTFVEKFKTAMGALLVRQVVVVHCLGLGLEKKIEVHGMGLTFRIV